MLTAHELGISTTKAWRALCSHFEGEVNDRNVQAHNAKPHHPHVASATPSADTQRGCMAGSVTQIAYLLYHNSR